MYFFVVAGRVLSGHLTLSQLKKGSGSAPSHVPLSYVVGPALESQSKDDKNGTKSRQRSAIITNDLFILSCSLCCIDLTPYPLCRQ